MAIDHLMNSFVPASGGGILQTIIGSQFPGKPEFSPEKNSHTIDLDVDARSIAFEINAIDKEKIIPRLEATWPRFNFTKIDPSITEEFKSGL